MIVLRAGKTIRPFLWQSHPFSVSTFSSLRVTVLSWGIEGGVAPSTGWRRSHMMRQPDNQPSVVFMSLESLERAHTLWFEAATIFPFVNELNAHPQIVWGFFQPMRKNPRLCDNIRGWGRRRIRKGGKKQSAGEPLPPLLLLPLHGGDVQRQPVIGGVNWQIQHESRACSLSSSTGEVGSLNREWILFMLP